MIYLSFYGIMTLISVVVRQFFLPNPFACFGDNAILINWYAEPIIQIIAYLIVGLVYISGTEPALGSFLYLVVYGGIVGLLWLLGIFSFAWWWILTIAIVVFALILGYIWLQEERL